MAVWVWRCDKCRAWHWAEGSRGAYSVSRYRVPDAAEDAAAYVFERGQPRYEYTGRPPAWLEEIEPDHV